MSKNATAQKIEQTAPSAQMKVLTPAKLEVKKEVVTPEVKEEPKPLTLAEIKRKNEVLSRLVERHEILSEKRKRYIRQSFTRILPL